MHRTHALVFQAMLSAGFGRLFSIMGDTGVPEVGLPAAMPACTCASFTQALMECAHTVPVQHAGAYCIMPSARSYWRARIYCVCAGNLRSEFPPKSRIHEFLNLHRRPVKRSLLMTKPSAEQVQVRLAKQRKAKHQHLPRPQVHVII